VVTSTAGAAMLTDTPMLPAGAGEPAGDGEAGICANDAAPARETSERTKVDRQTEGVRISMPPCIGASALLPIPLGKAIPPRERVYEPCPGKVKSPNYCSHGHASRTPRWASTLWTAPTCSGCTATACGSVRCSTHQLASAPADSPMFHSLWCMRVVPLTM